MFFIQIYFFFVEKAKITTTVFIPLNVFNVLSYIHILEILLNINY